MALASSLNNVKIGNNTVDVGLFSDGATPVTYTYDSCMQIGADSLISGNTISGCVGGSSGSTDLVTVISCSCLIQNNVFIRGAGSPVGSYLNFTGTDDNIVIDNIFDQPTIDGSSEELVTGLTSTSTYERNKNQTKHAAILPSAGEYRSSREQPDWTSAINFASEILNHPDDVNTYRYIVKTNVRSDAVASGRYIEYFFNLSNYLPKNVKVLGHLIGMKFGQLGSNLNTSVTSSVIVRTSTTLASLPVSGSFASPNSTLAYIDGDSDSGSSNLENTVTTTVNILSGAYDITTMHYNTADYSGNDFTIQNSTNVIVAVRYSFTTVVTQSSTNVLWSPLLIKYRW